MHESELEPFECIVCGRKAKNKPLGGFVYLAGVKPIGAIACTGKCVAMALGRFAETGRCDEKGMS